MAEQQILHFVRDDNVYLDDDNSFTD